MIPSKGLASEIELSKKWHQKMPVLISGHLLRIYNCGQVDLACWDGHTIVLIEVKQGPWITERQLMRLKRSAKWVSAILEKSVIIKVDWAGAPLVFDSGGEYAVE